jgi:hypothetical protein
MLAAKRNRRRVNCPVEARVKGRLYAVACVLACAAVAGCGGSSGSKVSSASLQPRLLPSSDVPGFGLERTLDWSDPVNLVGEGLFLPERTRPGSAVREFTGAHFRGAAGEWLTSGIGGENETEARLGVAQFQSAADASRVRDWMHREDLMQPCYSQCIFAPGPASIAGIPSVRYAVQIGHVPPPPKGVRPPPGARVFQGPANFLAEFTMGPRLYWAVLHAGPPARARFEAGIKLYYARAKEKG